MCSVQGLLKRYLSIRTTFVSMLQFRFVAKSPRSSICIGHTGSGSWETGIIIIIIRKVRNEGSMPSYHRVLGESLFEAWDFWARTLHACQHFGVRCFLRIQAFVPDYNTHLIIPKQAPNPVFLAPWPVRETKPQISIPSDKS